MAHYVQICQPHPIIKSTSTRGVCNIIVHSAVMSSHAVQLDLLSDIIGVNLLQNKSSMQERIGHMSK